MTPIVHHIMRIISGLFDLIFPPREKEKIVRQTKTLAHKPFYWQSHIALSHLAHPTTRAVITENKFHHNQTAARLLATMLEAWLQERAFSEVVVLIPIPLSRARRKERGHNQVTSVLDELKVATQYETRLLKRHRDTKPQTSLNKQKRAENVRDAFSVDEKYLKYVPARARVILIDDVVTTGATLDAARAKLAAHLPPNTTLTTLALAH